MKRIALLFLIPLPVVAWGADYQAKVVGISDGDTITVLRDRQQVKIRLHGIDAPESSQDFGSRAKQSASDLAFGRLVAVHPRDTDRYGRTVAEVFLPDGRSLNREMVRRGWLGGIAHTRRRIRSWPVSNWKRKQPTGAL